MPYKHFDDIPVITQILVFAAGVWGAIINWVSRNRRGNTFLHRLGFFLFDSLTIVGISSMTFLILSGYGFNDLFSVGVSSFMAHYGTRSFYLIEIIITEKLGATKTREEIKKDKSI